jgi:hypothetical protein
VVREEHIGTHNDLEWFRPEHPMYCSRKSLEYKSLRKLGCVLPEKGLG